MPKLFMIAVLMLGGIGSSPAEMRDLSRNAAETQMTTPIGVGQPLDPQKKAWFDRAVGNILDGPPSDGTQQSPAPQH